MDINSTDLSIVNYNCSTDESNENITLTEEDNLIDFVELASKEDEKYIDLSNINKTINLNDIINNKSNFGLDNLTNYVTFTVYEEKDINLKDESLFIIEGKTNVQIQENMYLELSLNNDKEDKINCNFSAVNNNSSLICQYDFNITNLETDENINVYYIKEKEFESNDITIYSL